MYQKKNHEIHNLHDLLTNLKELVRKTKPLTGDDELWRNSQSLQEKERKKKKKNESETNKEESNDEKLRSICKKRY